jgi:hypothetical protein
MILGDHLIPEKITEVLKIEPSEVWLKGQQKSYINNEGAVNKFGDIYEWSGWKCFIPEEEKACLELHEQLIWWCNQLEGRESAMHELEKKGCSLQISCFISTNSTASIILSADLQQRLSNIRLELSFSIFVD